MREHRLTRRVLFYEVDSFGIVHFSTYFRYMEEAEHALWRAAGLNIAPTDRNIGFPRVAAACEYLAPLRFEDEFEAHVRVEALSRRSIRFVHVISRGETTIATGTITTVCVATDANGALRAIPIPEDIVAGLSEASEEGERVKG
jgi:acyl-CoA thioester hydrolase